MASKTEILDINQDRNQDRNFTIENITVVLYLETKKHTFYRQVRRSASLNTIF